MINSIFSGSTLGLSSTIAYIEQSLLNCSLYIPNVTENLDLGPNQIFNHVGYKKAREDEIVEVLQSQAGFTIATDTKPILATYGCGPCVALGGYEKTNKIAFIVHFAAADEVRKFGGRIFYQIANLAKEKIVNPIQLHLRGGVKDLSGPIIKAIKIWMKIRPDLPMKITSQDILSDGMFSSSKSLLIDSRTGVVADYDPTTNPKSKGMTELDVMAALISAYFPQITLVYTPKSLETHDTTKKQKILK